MLLADAIVIYLHNSRGGTTTWSPENVDLILT